MDIKEFGKKIDRTILTEATAADLEKRRPFNSAMTPLHGLYAEFMRTACNQECFSSAEYYCNRCMTPLCFVRWLVLHGYAQFEDNELTQSIVEEVEEK